MHNIDKKIKNSKDKEKKNGIIIDRGEKKREVRQSEDSEGEERKSVAKEVKEEEVKITSGEKEEE